jgi:predicted PurR-regulated permease PerM
MRSRLLPLPADPRWRRLFALVVFLGVLVGVRHLALLFICFVLFSRGLGRLSALLGARLRIRRHRVLVSLLGLLAGGLGLGVLIGVRRLEPFIVRARTEWHDWWDAINANPALVKFRELTGVSDESFADTAKHHALHAMHYLDATAHGILYVLIGLIVAVMFLFEREEVVAWRGRLQPDGITDVLVRWLGYVADAIVVTARIQVVVAVVNAIVTLPVLLLVGMKHVAMLSMLILISGLVPVVGNFISGAVLCVVAFESKGAWAVGVFVASTFVLHKIEAYYLNPRLAAEHVHLPALLLVVSLILFEHFFGLAGLFLSFPTLYVGSRILNEWNAEVAKETLTTGGEPSTA